MATATPSQAQALAAAVAAGANQANAQRANQRSQYLAQVLAQLGKSGGENIRSPAQLGMNLLAVAIAQHGKRNADRDLSGVQQQIAKQLYPNNPDAQLRWLVDPENMNKSAAAAYAPMAVKPGETVTYGQGGSTYTAPIMRDDGGVMGNQTLEGFTPTAMRAPNYGELTSQQSAQTQAAQQREAARHNLEVEGIDKSKIPIELGMMNIAMRNSNTTAGQLGLGQSNSPTFAIPPGYRPIAGGQ